MSAIIDYFVSLGEVLGNSWNRFWYTKSDAYPLAILRIITGVAALYYIATWTPDLVFMFGSGGLLPRDIVDTYRGTATIFSYFNWIQSPGGLMVAHIAGIVAVILYTLGVKTRITSVAALVVTLSYIQRAPMLMTPFEPILALAMFYLCIGPSGQYLSFDAWWTRRKMPMYKPQPCWSANIAIRLLQLHICVVYFMSAIAKLTAETWWEGSAVWWLISRTETAPFDLMFLSKHEYFINFLTHFIALYELAFPILIWNRWARPLLLLLSPIAWGLVALFTGMFAYAAIMLSINLAFVPVVVLRSIGKKKPASTEPAARVLPQRTPDPVGANH